jgi:septal ring factor EnvC (AmiA/AmiB activator)
MPIEDRVTTLEQQFMTYMADNNRQMVVFNRVMAQQELNIRDVEKNETILLGMATSQEHETRDMKERLSQVETRLSQVETHLSQVETRLDTLGQQVDMMGATINQKLDAIMTLLQGKAPTP